MTASRQIRFRSLWCTDPRSGSGHTAYLWFDGPSIMKTARKAWKSSTVRYLAAWGVTPRVGT